MNAPIMLCRRRLMYRSDVLANDLLWKSNCSLTNPRILIRSHSLTQTHSMSSLSVGDAVNFEALLRNMYSIQCPAYHDLVLIHLQAISDGSQQIFNQIRRETTSSTHRSLTAYCPISSEGSLMAIGLGFGTLCNDTDKTTR